MHVARWSLAPLVQLNVSGTEWVVLVAGFPVTARCRMERFLTTTDGDSRRVTSKWAQRWVRLGATLLLILAGRGALSGQTDEIREPSLLARLSVPVAAGIGSGAAYATYAVLDGGVWGVAGSTVAVVVAVDLVERILGQPGTFHAKVAGAVVGGMIGLGVGQVAFDNDGDGAAIFFSVSQGLFTAVLSTLSASPIGSNDW